MGLRAALYPPPGQVQLTGEGLIYQVTASGGYEDCIGMLADELADLVDEPFVRLVIRMTRGRRRRWISKRAYMPRGELVSHHTTRVTNGPFAAILARDSRYESARGLRAATLTLFRRRPLSTA